MPVVDAESGEEYLDRDALISQASMELQELFLLWKATSHTAHLLFVDNYQLPSTFAYSLKSDLVNRFRMICDMQEEDVDA